VFEETLPLVRRLAAERAPGDGVYVYYGAAPAFRFYHPEMDPHIVVGGSHRDQEAQYEAELRPLLVPGTRLWILFAHAFQTEPQSILNDVKLYARPLDATGRTGASLHLFAVERGPDSVRHIRLPAPPPPSPP
jgi:hypothetical protein